MHKINGVDAIRRVCHHIFDHINTFAVRAELVGAASVGAGVGVTGLVVGLAVGSEKGASVGAGVGAASAVDMVVGLAVAALVGLVVGFAVGSKTGSSSSHDAEQNSLYAASHDTPMHHSSEMCATRERHSQLSSVGGSVV